MNHLFQANFHYPWLKIGSDLFSLDGNTYFLVVDYSSRQPEIVKLSSLTTKAVIESLKSIFSRHGVPQILMSDNGPQYSSHELAIFTKQYDFSHLTYSPHFPQSNDHAERIVQTVIKLLKSSGYPHLA